MVSKMKFCIISTGYPSNKNPTGVIFVHEQAKELVNQGQEVHVICCGPKNENKEEIIDGVHIHRVMDEEFKFKRLFGFYFCFKSLLKAYVLNRRVNINIIHSHFADIPGFAGAITSKFLKKPFVISAHGSDIFSFKRLNYGASLNKTLKIFVNFSFKLSKKVIVYSLKSKKQCMERWHVPEKKISVQSHWVSEELIKFKSRKKQGIILTVANLVPIKNLIYAIRAIKFVSKEFPDVKYVVIGDGPEKNRLKKYIKKLNLERNVFLIGCIDRKKILDYYSSSSIFVLPSIHESFGIVKIEAMAFKLPLIVTEGCSEGVQNNENGYIVPLNNAKLFSKKIILLLKNKKLVKKMGDEGRKRVLNFFLWEHNVKNLIKVYESLVEDEGN